ncbi:PI-PLC X domain-containing protein 1 [Paramyrothecium foliicola]|nr:PI-PLC X domain-containing protein 1 [Paramyrothecium foliicola]
MHFFGWASLALAVGTFAQDACNGFAELCDRKYSDITFMASHNAAFVGRLPSHNQFQYPEAGMDMGIRYFTTQVHIENGEIRQCHSDCALLNVGSFSEILASLTNWLNNHPREVVTLQIGNGDDAIRIEEFVPHFQKTGADKLAYVPNHRLDKDQWPTLRQLIDANKRLIIFMDYYADTSKVPYILPNYDAYVETPFSPTKDNFFNCDIDRPNRGASADNRMIWANHNLNLKLFGSILVPAPVSAPQTNSIANIRQQTEICVSKYGRNPNVVMLDFVSEGQVIAAQRLLNGL